MILFVYLYFYVWILKSVYEGGGDGEDNFVCLYLVILFFEFNNFLFFLDLCVICEI